MTSIPNHTEKPKEPSAIVIRSEYTTHELHDGIETYIAAQRVKGRKLLKPTATVELIMRGLQTINE